MKKSFRYFALMCSMLAMSAAALCQTYPEDLREKIDAVVLAAYQKASEQFPCKLKTRGKAKMAHWQQIEKCLNYANNRVDWVDINGQIRRIGQEYRVPEQELMSLAGRSLSAHALPYDRVFTLKNEKALLPLSSSLLKFLPEDSLIGLPVIDSSGKEIGTFEGVYTFERPGGLLSGSILRYSLFQYKDVNGRIQSAPDKLLLDSFGVPWKGAGTQPGFRFPLHQLEIR